MYPVDANVLSAGAPGRREQSATLVEWMDMRSRELFLSVVTVAEITDGIAKLTRTGSASKAAGLADWLELVLQLFGERVLPFDVAAARLAGALMDEVKAAGHTVGFPDIAIAATALCRGLTILTGNLRHFTPLRVRAYDPFDALPD